MPSARNFLSPQEREKIVAAIQEAEGKTSGEIRVFLEKRCKKDALDRAVEVFHNLKMHETKHGTGVLIYVAYADKKLAIVGDKGIHKKVPENFWDETKEIMKQHFQAGEFAEGLIKAIALSGNHLKKHFAADAKNPNELSDDIVFGDET